ncbi:hypothetical protein, unlikely [Trypanosoma brucei gambiense DAL972]|uniref:Uncharacterized protein n=2 Tax=Trypanosoma brucei TaxID=5691 RepID=Q57TX4_TRYB2|nr:hypothetical protein, unlikely [Trypanosoma brucei gambiense DAL972]XP_846357.1 hypothetical protein Tb927.7.7370 [Trypanosoma brucei brucei TREU927]AAX79981.1 hypothetical protein Tb927.7.7370 [Trypanosoma brucei]AAZ12798.1 hypothetical protein Tb927.7.7370 [Trypanosoma brucei brucei TREU927]CBH13019.1 hypothetical protein, unlikely [Trypanosoma brucei gambiense DAL972]|eukprot:XP_011775297.1 hypothetical protein, unlikely [Trypanosoma brucei gambiense DAL972]
MQTCDGGWLMLCNEVRASRRYLQVNVFVALPFRSPQLPPSYSLLSGHQVEETTSSKGEESRKVTPAIIFLLLPSFTRELPLFPKCSFCHTICEGKKNKEGLRVSL